MDIASIVVTFRSPVGTGDMAKQNWINPARTTTFLTTLLCAGLIQNGFSYAQSPEDNIPAQDGTHLIPGGSMFGTGILPPFGRIGSMADLTPSARYGIALGPSADDPTDTSHYWLELGSTSRSEQGMRGQIGLGYSPSPEIGFAMGPFFDLDSSAPGGIGVYQTDEFAAGQSTRHGFVVGGDGLTNDAGLAGSLSYMPLPDIWIGMHGSVSRDLGAQNPNDGLLDGIDAMLGLTASYRIKF